MKIQVKILREGKNSFIVKEIKNFETENTETIYLWLIIAKKKWCVLLACRPPSINKTILFNEICITLNKILDKYILDSILLAGDLNIDELKPGSDSSNYLSDAKNIFKLRNFLKSQNFAIGPCHKEILQMHLKM